MTHTAIEKIKELDEQKSALADEAKQEAMRQAEAAIEVLNALGYRYAITEEGNGTKKNGSRRGTRKPNPDKPCPVCQFKTDPPHDGRHHRNQTIKAPFTPEELASKGMTRVTSEAVTELQAAE